jgi:Tfp pilus assembly protein PilO
MDLRRIASEKRALVFPLALLLVVNAAVLIVAVYPLRASVASAEARAVAAAQTLRAAEENHAAAQATLVGKGRADAQLQRFYGDVLPRDQTGARRITYLRLAQLAERSNLRYERRQSVPERDRDSQLARLRMSMVLAGEYRDIRRFIHQLETAPEFVIIDNVSLAQSEGQRSAIVLSLDVSTYYWTGGDEG